MSNSVAVSPAQNLSDFMGKFRGQIANALPTHITPERMIRLTLTSFSKSKGLQKCDLMSIFSSVMMASQLGLEIGVGGQGFLIPYKTTCQFVPGWQGLVDLVSRSGRATVWTGAVFSGDEFDWALGDTPFIKHKPVGDSDNWREITHVYAVGRAKGSDWPVIEVWTMDRIIRHLNKYNKVGGEHYALVKDGINMEMYARKIPLLQVMKYMPKSVEVQRAMDVANAVESGKGFTFDGEVVVIDDADDIQGGDEQAQAGDGDGKQSGNRKQDPFPTVSEESFTKRSKGWRELVLNGTKTAADLIAQIQTREILTEAQQKTIDFWSHEND